MNKGLLVMGIILIIVLEYVLFLVNDLFRIFYPMSEIEYVIIIFYKVLALFLIMLYNYRQHKKYELNDKIYFISTIASCISLTFIAQVIRTLCCTFDSLNFIISSKIIRFALSSINFYSIGDFMEKYAVICVSIAIAAYIKIQKDTLNVENKVQENNANSYNYYNGSTAYFDEQYNTQFGFPYDEQTIKTKSKISGIKAGFIIIFCQILSVASLLMLNRLNHYL